MIECIQRVITSIAERVRTQGAMYGVTTFLYDSFGSLTNETVIGVAEINTIERYWDDFGRNTGYAHNSVRQTTIGYEPDRGRIGMDEFDHLSWNLNAPGRALDEDGIAPNNNDMIWRY